MAAFQNVFGNPRLLALGVMSYGVMACAEKGADTADSQRAESASAQPAAVPVPAARTTTYELPTRIGNMTGKDFHNWLIGSTKPKWREKARKTKRKCTDEPGRDDCRKTLLTERLTVHIDASKDANSLDLEAIPANGVVMARLTVDEPRHKVIDERYGFRYDYTYYLVVEPSGQLDGHKPKEGEQPNHAGKWYWVELNKDGEQTIPIAKTGLFRRCYPKHEPAKEKDPHAAFTMCNVTGDTTNTPSHERVAELMAQLDSVEASVGVRTPTPAERAKINQLEVAIASEFINELSGPAWMSCSHGCCIADS